MQEELKKIDTSNKEGGKISVKREYQGSGEQPEMKEAFKDFFEFKNKDRRPQYDASQNEKFLNTYLEKFI